MTYASMFPHTTKHWIIDKLTEYEKARQWDETCHEADNSGNVAGDELANLLYGLFEIPGNPRDSVPNEVAVEEKS